MKERRQMTKKYSRVTVEGDSRVQYDDITGSSTNAAYALTFGNSLQAVAYR